MCQKTALFVAGAEEGGGVEEKEAEALGEAAAGELGGGTAGRTGPAATENRAAVEADESCRQTGALFLLREAVWGGVSAAQGEKRKQGEDT